MSKFIDNQKVRGFPTFKLYDENMNLKAEWDVENLIVTTGKEWIAGKMDDSVDPTAMSHMAIGTSATPEVIGDTALQTETARVALTDTVNTGASVLYTATFGPGVGTGVLREAGILNAASVGTLLCRVTYGIQTKEAGDTLTVSWTINITQVIYGYVFICK